MLGACFWPVLGAPYGIGDKTVSPAHALHALSPLSSLWPVTEPWSAYPVMTKAESEGEDLGTGKAFGLLVSPFKAWGRTKVWEASQLRDP